MSAGSWRTIATTYSQATWTAAVACCGLIGARAGVRIVSAGRVGSSCTSALSRPSTGGT